MNETKSRKVRSNNPTLLDCVRKRIETLRDRKENSRPTITHNSGLTLNSSSPSTFRRDRRAVRRLFEHPFEIERDYFRRTGIFPIMHTLVVKKELLEANPWVAFTLFKAFSEAKDLAMADLTQTSALPLSLPFLVEHAYETIDLMGEDFWPYGLESNRRTLETFVRYMHEQGLIAEPMALETLFPESTQ